MNRGEKTKLAAILMAGYVTSPLWFLRSVVCFCVVDVKVNNGVYGTRRG